MIWNGYIAPKENEFMQSNNLRARNRAILYVLIGLTALLYMVAFIRVGGNPFPRKIYKKSTHTTAVIEQTEPSKQPHQTLKVQD